MVNAYSSATELAAAIKSRAVSSRELLEVYIERIEKYDQKIDYLNTRDDWLTEPEDAAAAGQLSAIGDLGPEGLLFVPAKQSPNGKPLLIVGNEVSGTTAILQLNLTF